MLFRSYMLVEMMGWERWVCVIAALLMISPELISTLVGAGMVVPVLMRHLAARKALNASPA